MKVSYSWLKDYLPAATDLPVADAAAILTSTGLEVEGVERFEQIKGGLKGVVSGHVLTCEKHPEADRLSLTTVDTGGSEPLSIVCGAPNVRAGQKVLVATVGTQLTFADGKELEIKKSKIRGAVSEGMICAEDELGIGASHDGILVLHADTPVGVSASEILGLYEDDVLEIGLTPNRPDANGHLGVARDLAAVLKTKHGHATAEGLRYPNLDSFEAGTGDAPISVAVLDTKACPRYAGIYLRGVQVGPSPAWLQRRLEAIGQRPINNVVDVTNYILHEYGQPMHAFDAGKIKGSKVIVRTLPAGTVFVTLDGVTRSLHEEDLMICDADSQGMCIAGVFGGSETGVGPDTRDVFLESAHFAAASVRRTKSRHQLHTEAARAYEKGTDPNVCIDALKRAVLLLQEIAGAEPAGPVIDIYDQPVTPLLISLEMDYLNSRAGVSFTAGQVSAILDALEMPCTETGTGVFEVSVPTNKPDVTRPIDLVEEILRIYGLDEVPVPQQMRYAVSPSAHPDPGQFRESVADMLVARGFHEMMALSITQSRYYLTILPVPDEELVYINNTSNTHLDVMRADLLAGGLETIAYNLNRRQTDLRLFEFGFAYRSQEDGAYRETEQLCLLLSGQQTEPSWIGGKPRPQDFYSLKTEVHALLERIGCTNYQAAELDDPAFAFGMRYARGQDTLVSFGKIDGKVRQGFEIRQDVLAAVFDWGNIWKAVRKQKIHLREISKFPEVQRDLAMILDKRVRFADVERLAFRTGKQLLSEIRLFDVYEDASHVGEGKKSYAVSLTLRPGDRTLSDKEIDRFMQDLIREAEQQLGALVRKG